MTNVDNTLMEKIKERKEKEREKKVQQCIPYVLEVIKEYPSFEKDVAAQIGFIGALMSVNEDINVSKEDIVLSIKGELEAFQIAQNNRDSFVKGDTLQQRKPSKELQEVLEHFSGSKRELLRLRFLYDLTQLEAAEQMGVTLEDIMGLERECMEELREKQKEGFKE